MLNENLARVRKERGLTQEALAVKLNVVRQTISKWEKGTASGNDHSPWACYGHSTRGADQ